MNDNVPYFKERANASGFMNYQVLIAFLQNFPSLHPEHSKSTSSSGFRMAKWQLISQWGIKLKGDPTSDLWRKAFFNAGRVEDIIRLEDTAGPIVLAASPTSGLWRVFPDTDDAAVSLSLDWDWVNLSCVLSNQTRTHQIYAGGQALHMSDLTLAEPLDHFVEIKVKDETGKSFEFININRMALLPLNVDVNILVLACDDGLLWANIPPGTGTNYVFRRATVKTGIGSEVKRFSSVVTVKVASATGDINRVVAAAWGDSKSSWGLFVGELAAGDLQFRPLDDAQFSATGFSQAEMRRTSLAVSPAQPTLLYVLAGNQLDGMYCVVRGVLDPGLHWNFTAATTHIAGASDSLFGKAVKGDSSTAGGQEFYNNSIAISPSDTSQVAVGWQNGYFLLSNPGTTSEVWRYVTAKSDNFHLHEDVHALLFAPDGTLYIGSDGGLATTKDYGMSHSSIANRHLPNFQVYGISLNPQTDGVSAASVQDHGTLATNVYPVQWPWNRLQRGDGYFVQFLRDGRLLDLVGSFGQEDTSGINERLIDDFSRPSQVPGWSQEVGLIPLEGRRDTGLGFKEEPEFPFQPPRETTGARELVWPHGEIEIPTRRGIVNKYLTALAADGGNIYGLMKGTPRKDLFWTLLGTVSVDATTNERASCLGSVDGSVIFVGTDQGSIFRMTAPSDPTAMTWTEVLMTKVIPVRALTTTTILQFKLHLGDAPLAITTGSRILQLNGTKWTDLPSASQTMIPPPPHDFVEEYTGIETDGVLDRPATKIFLSTDRRIFQSSDMTGTTTWANISPGLPQAPHCRDIRFIRESAGLEFLYAATYGWSVWRRQMNTPSPAALARFRDVTLSFHSIGVTIIYASGDTTKTFLASARTVRVSMTHPVEEVSNRTAAVENVWVQFKVRWEYHVDDSVEAKWEALLNNSYSGKQGVQTGSITVAPGATERGNVRLNILDKDGDPESISDVNYILTN